MRSEANVISMEKYRLKLFLEKNGYQWLEDKNGKVRIWIRKGGQNNTSRTTTFSPEKE